MLIDVSRKTRKTHIQKTHTRTHTQTQKFLGRHMVQRQVRDIRCLTCQFMFIQYTNRETVVYTILKKARDGGLCYSCSYLHAKVSK